MKQGAIIRFLLLLLLVCIFPLSILAASGAERSPFRYYRIRYKHLPKKQKAAFLKKKHLVYSEKGEFNFHVGGLFKVDTMSFGNAPQLSGNERLNRATYKLYFEANKAWQLNIDYDSAIPEWRNLNVTYVGWEHGVFLVGSFSPVWGLSNSADTSAFSNLELPLPYGGPFAPTYAPGAEAGLIYDPFTFYVAFYTSPIGQQVTPPQPLTYFVNFEYSPVHTAHDVFVIELSGWEQNANGSNSFDFAFVPEITAHNQGNLIDTGVISSAKNFWIANAAVGWERGPWSVQSEYEHVWTTRARALGVVNFNAVYATAGYFLTGESRLFDFKYAGYIGITPIVNRNTGAWQIVTRVSYLNLSDQNVNGGNETDFTLGLNWWPVHHLRVQLNYIRAWATPNSAGINQTSNFAGMRMQLHF